MKLRLCLMSLIMILLIVSLSYGQTSNKFAPANNSAPQNTSLSKTQPEQNESNIIAHGNIQIKLYREFTNTEMKEIEKEYPEFLDKLTYLGWRYDGQKLYHFWPAGEIKIKLNNEQVDVKDGKYTLLAKRGFSEEQRKKLKNSFRQERKKASSPVTLFFQNKEIPKEMLEVANLELGLNSKNPLTLDIIINVEYLTMKSKGMCHQEDESSNNTATNYPYIRKASYNNPQSEPMERCMDYNGPMSDGVNYPKTDWRAFRNFVGSDCYLTFCVLPICLLDHLVGGCQKAHIVLCSTFIGHSHYYHQHSWSDGQCK